MRPTVTQLDKNFFAVLYKYMIYYLIT